MKFVTDTLPWGRPLSADDFFALTTPDDRQRYELIDGVLVVIPSPDVQDQRVVRELLRQLGNQCPDSLEVFGSPLDVTLSERTVVEPDVLVVDRADAVGRRLTGLPLLVLERERYAAAGVPT